MKCLKCGHENFGTHCKSCVRIEKFKENKAVRKSTVKELIRHSNKLIFRLNAGICRLHGLKATIESMQKLNLTIPRNLKGN